MTFVSKYADNPKYRIDKSQDNKYLSRTDCLLNILFCAGEIPNKLYLHMNISYDCFRQNISRLLRRGLIQRISADSAAGYILTLKGKKLTRELHYMKYRVYVEEETDRHYSIKRRRRKRQQACLFALMDRAGIAYELFSKPSFEDAVHGDTVYYYEAIEFKRLIGYESTAFQGSKLLGFFAGRNKIIPIYKTNMVVSSLGKHERLVPEALKRYFSATVDTAVLLCEDVGGALTQIVDGYNYYNERINTAGYQFFYVLSTGDVFLSQFYDLYKDDTSTESEIIERYHIDTSEKDSRGRYRYIIGTGFIDDSPAWICTGNVNTVKLRPFIRNAELNDQQSFLFCKQRDAEILESIIGDAPIDIIII